VSEIAVGERSANGPARELAERVADPERLAALRQYDLLDTPPEEEFDRLTSLACRLLSVPLALVSLVDSDRQFFKSQQGLPPPLAEERETPLSHSFCQHIVVSREPLIVEDARQHAVLHSNRAIPDLGVVGYAGIPLVSASGHVIGSFCAIDTVPHAWTETEISILTDLAALAMTEIELRVVARDATRAADRLFQLQAVTSLMAVAKTPGEVADVILSRGLQAMRADSGSVVLVDPHDKLLRIVSASGYPRQIVDGYQSFSADTNVPIARAIQTGQGVFLQSSSAWVDNGFDGVELHEQAGGRAAAAVPLQVDGDTLGALGLSFSKERTFGEDDQQFMISLARQCAQALERARYFVAEQSARNAAEAVRERLEFLLDASTVLADSLEFHATLCKLAELVVSSLADICYVDMLNRDGGIERVVALHADPAMQYLVDTLRDHFAPRIDGDHPTACVLRTGVSQISSEITDELLESAAHDEEHIALLRQLGHTSFMCVPLMARQHMIGALMLVSTDPYRKYGPADLALAEDLARRTATMVDNARLLTETQQALQVREEFTSIASHELKTPLTALQLQVQMLQRNIKAGKPDIVDRIPAGLSAIERQLQRFSKLINDLMDVTRVSSGHLDLTVQRVDLATVIADVVQRITGDGSVTPTITVNTAPGLIGMWDWSRIDQVVTNLLSNALKYGEGKPVEIEASVHDGMAWLQVTDHGTGIAPELQPVIFDRFERAVGANAPSGLGLGLYIARQIVVAHGGTITVTSTLGEGATFEVRLPLAG